MQKIQFSCAWADALNLSTFVFVLYKAGDMQISSFSSNFALRKSFWRWWVKVARDECWVTHTFTHAQMLHIKWNNYFCLSGMRQCFVCISAAILCRCQVESCVSFTTGMISFCLWSASIILHSRLLRFVSSGKVISFGAFTYAILVNKEQ